MSYTFLTLVIIWFVTIFTVQPGKNDINRQSNDSTLTIPFERTFRNLDDQRPSGGEALESFNFCGCGWPQHMLVPKGTKEGFRMDMFVMISDFAGDEVRIFNSFWPLLFIFNKLQTSHFYVYRFSRLNLLGVRMLQVSADCVIANIRTLVLWASHSIVAHVPVSKHWHNSLLLTWQLRRLRYDSLIQWGRGLAPLSDYLPDLYKNAILPQLFDTDTTETTAVPGQWLILFTFYELLMNINKWYLWK